jgi:hypothetical protein
MSRSSGDLPARLRGEALQRVDVKPLRRRQGTPLACLPSLLRRSSFGYEGRELRRRHGGIFQHSPVNNGWLPGSGQLVDEISPPDIMLVRSRGLNDRAPSSQTAPEASGGAEPGRQARTEPTRVRGPSHLLPCTWANCMCQNC